MDDFIADVKRHAFRQAARSQRSFPFPLSNQDIAAVETHLGFRIPDLLRGLYSEVADGGFGPGNAFRFAGGIDRLSVAAARYHQQRRYGPGDKDWEDGEVVWPLGLLPICDWGCGRFSSIDCTHAPFPIVYHHSEFRENDGGVGTCPGSEEMRERLDEYGFFETYGRLYGNSWVVAKSLQAWLTAWMNDEAVEELGHPASLLHGQTQGLRYMD